MGELLTSLFAIAIGIFMAYTAGRYTIITWIDNIKRAKNNRYSIDDPLEELSEKLGLNVLAMAIICLLGVGFFVAGILSLYQILT